VKYWFVFYIVLCAMTIGIRGTEAAEVYCSLNDGNKADGKTVLEEKGIKHQFCCSGCLDQFKANPDKFAQQMHQSSSASSPEAEAACSSVCGE
jgi:YHS domain-containing protein